MNNYELYDFLLNESLNNPKVIEPNFICGTFNSLNKYLNKEECYEHFSEITALILHYQYLNYNKFQKTKAPCKGKIMFGGKGIKYILDDLPSDLINILNEYILYYIEQ